MTDSEDCAIKVKFESVTDAYQEGIAMFMLRVTGMTGLA